MVETAHVGLTGFQAWFLESCPDALTAEVATLADLPFVRITRMTQPAHATLVSATTDDATRAVFDALPALATSFETVDVICDGRAWTIAPAPLLVPQIERTEGTDPSIVRLATTRSVLYPQELPYPLPLLAQDVETNAGTVSLRLWVCLRWDGETLFSVRTNKAGASQRAWLNAVAARPQVSRILHVQSVDLTGGITLDATTTFPTRSWAEALWGVR